jgi:hypothetical protein
MYLRELKIEKKRYGPQMGKIIATVTIGHEMNAMTLELSEEASERILMAACDELVIATTTAAAEFRNQIMAALLPEPIDTEAAP